MSGKSDDRWSDMYVYVGTLYSLGNNGVSFGYGYTYWEMPLHKRGVCVNELVYPVYLLI